MTRVVVAASMNNELRSRDVAAVQKLQQAGYEVQFYYYLPKVPAEFTMIPSFSEEVKDWRNHAHKLLDELGEKLNIPAGQRHLADEILGPDKVFDDAKAMDADVILTSNKAQLKQSLFGRLYDHLIGIFSKHKDGKEVPVEDINTYVTHALGAQAAHGDKIVDISRPEWKKRKAA